jgi:phosphoglycolate phosphatase
LKPLLLFDMDGTLLDTRLDIARAANLARKELGLHPMSVDEVVNAVGDGVNLFVSRVTFPTDDPRFASARKVFLRHYRDNVIGDTKPYDGVEDVLKELKARKYPLAIVSNKPFELVDILVKHFRWQSHFKAWLGGDSADLPKPSRAPLDFARIQSGVSDNYPLIMIGDGQQDIMAAAAANCPAIWCEWGFNKVQPEGGPAMLCRTPLDLLSMI